MFFFKRLMPQKTVYSPFLMEQAIASTYTDISILLSG